MATKTLSCPTGFVWLELRGGRCDTHASACWTILNQTTCSVGTLFRATGFSCVFQNSMLNSSYCKTKHFCAGKHRTNSFSFSLLFTCSVSLMYPHLGTYCPPVAVLASLRLTTFLIWMSCYFLTDLLFSKHFSLYKAFFQLFIFWRFMHN